MRINIPNINKLIENNFRGNKTFFAETIGISREYVSQILNGKKEADSTKFCNATIRYCEKNNLNYKDYIFLE